MDYNTNLGYTRWVLFFVGAKHCKGVLLKIILPSPFPCWLVVEYTQKHFIYCFEGREKREKTV